MEVGEEGANGMQEITLAAPLEIRPLTDVMIEAHDEAMQPGRDLAITNIRLAWSATSLRSAFHNKRAVHHPTQVCVGRLCICKRPATTPTPLAQPQSTTQPEPPMDDVASDAESDVGWVDRLYQGLFGYEQEGPDAMTDGGPDTDNAFDHVPSQIHLHADLPGPVPAHVPGEDDVNRMSQFEDNLVDQRGKDVDLSRLGEVQSELKDSNLALVPDIAGCDSEAVLTCNFEALRTGSVGAAPSGAVPGRPAVPEATARKAIKLWAASVLETWNAFRFASRPERTRLQDKDISLVLQTQHGELRCLRWVFWDVASLHMGRFVDIDNAGRVKYTHPLPGNKRDFTHDIATGEIV
eukprot:3349636-Alexandrium_andersonii.AAC.1